MARVNDVASNVSFGRDHELLHAIPHDYLVDQQAGITDPIGMTGSRLEAEVYLVTVLSSALHNLRKCVEKAGFHVGEFVLEPLAASLAVLTPDERELGCAIVELGGGSTNVAIFQDGKIRHTALAPLRRRARHQRHRARAAGHAAGRRADQGAVRRGLRAAGARDRHLRAARHAGTGGPHGAAPGARAHHAHAAPGVLEFALDEITRAGYHQQLPAGSS